MEDGGHVQDVHATWGHFIKAHIRVMNCTGFVMPIYSNSHVGPCLEPGKEPRDRMRSPWELSHPYLDAWGA